MAVSELVKTLLTKRGIEKQEDIDTFLSPDYVAHTHNPFLLVGMDKAVERVLKAIAGNERIAVYADFDCDGIPGAAVLSDFFTKIGYENFEVYLPHRDREGYGFHTEAIAELAARDVKLIITVDVGTTAVASVQFAQDRGLDVIVTDHHEIIGELPKAYAVLNPKLGEYPFASLCGAAMAFKLVQAALITGKQKGLALFTVVPDGWEKWLLDLVCIATIADMVPLVGENRVLARFGLSVLRKSPRPGILALCTKLRLKRGELTEDDIGFSIAPRINAASRMDEPDLAYRLLVTKDTIEAEKLADHLEELNASRKGVVSAIVKKARKVVSARYTDADKVVVLGDTEWKPALMGLAANSIMGDRGGVVCMWGRDAHGRLKGSCRSDGAVSLVEMFESAGDAFEQSGGHAFSGGFSVSHERVHTLPDVLRDVVGSLSKGMAKTKANDFDADLTLSGVAWPVYREVTQLGPFGTGNPKPVFHIKNTVVTSLKMFGKEKNHVELMVRCTQTGTVCRAFDFFRAPKDFSQIPEQNMQVSLLATMEKDSYRGGLVLRLVDVLGA